MNNVIEKYDLVIIGGGSGGLASAISAYDNGIKSILIIEKEDYLGGILLQCIHNGFGLHTFKEELTGPEYAEKYIEEINKRHINYKVSTMVLNITPTMQIHYSNAIDGYKIIETKAMILATGCSERTRGAINIPGDRPSGVITAGLAQKYLNINGYLVGKKVFILGSGDIGLIMARRMTLEGAKVLGVAEIMPYSNGLNRNIVQCLNDYNIPLYLHHTVCKIIGKERLEKIIICEVDDNLKYIKGTEQEIEVDTLLLSIGLIPSNSLLENLGVKMHQRTKGPLVDETMQTSMPGVFACGNSLHVHDVVDFVSLEGQKAGFYASEYIKKGNIKKSSIPVTNGFGIGYVLPTTISFDVESEITINFRVTKPFKRVRLIAKQNNQIIKSIIKQYLLPAEMENIKLNKENILDLSTITIEVVEDE